MKDRRWLVWGCRMDMNYACGGQLCSLNDWPIHFWWKWHSEVCGGWNNLYNEDEYDHGCSWVCHWWWWWWCFETLSFVDLRWESSGASGIVLSTMDDWVVGETLEVTIRLKTNRRAEIIPFIPLCDLLGNGELYFMTENLQPHMHTVLLIGQSGGKSVLRDHTWGTRSSASCHLMTCDGKKRF